MPPDPRDVTNGLEIPSEGYCDQPYMVINDDGSWTCVMTTGRGHEGQRGQHVVACRSTDHGETWSANYDIEPADGPEASWVMPFRAPGTGRIYAFYTYNSENLRKVKTVDGCELDRVDSLGIYAYKYSDDMGRTWSRERFEIPMRSFDCDRRNVYGGNVKFFWGVGKPFVHAGAVYVCASKVGGFGTGFFVQNEGVLFRSPNLLTEADPSRHLWETLPEGDVGLRAPPDGGPIAGEFNATPMNDSSLYGTYRTISGFSCHACSRDGGRTWKSGYMTYTPGGRRVKNPRAANFVRRFENGKYLYWFHFYGGEVLGRAPDVAGGNGYQHRNPAWLCGGVERNGHIHWSQPEIALYDECVGTRMSYPDLLEQDGEFYISETQKTVARIHRIDKSLIEGMWAQGTVAGLTRNGLVGEWNGEKTMPMQKLPPIWQGGGCSIEIGFILKSLTAGQVLFDSRDGEGRGITIITTDRGTLKLTVCSRVCDLPGASWAGGMVECSWETDRHLLTMEKPHLICFIMDGGPKIISVLVDGMLCDGGRERQYGWGRFHPLLKEANGASAALVAPSLNGKLLALRVYNRYLRTSEAVANFEHFRITRRSTCETRGRWCAAGNP